MLKRPDERLSVDFFVNFIHEQGTYFRFHNLAVALAAQDHDVRVEAADFDARGKQRAEWRDGVLYRVVPESPPVYAFQAPCHPLTAVRRATRRYRKVHVAHVFQPFPSAAAAWMRSPAMIRCYDWDDLWGGGFFSGRLPPRIWWPSWVTGRLERSLPRKADSVTVVSSDLRRRATLLGARNVEVLRNGLAPTEAPRQDEARRHFGLDPDALYVGFMGRTTDELEWCVAAVAQADHDVRLALCGPKPDVANIAVERLQARCDYLGSLPPEQMPAFAAALDLGLLPLEDNPFNRSRFPIKFAEYLAAGTPVLCSAVGDVGALAQESAGIISGGVGRDEWIRRFNSALGRIRANTLPPFDDFKLVDELQWGRLASQLVDHYRELLGADTNR